MTAKELAKAGQFPTAVGITHTVPGADSVVTIAIAFSPVVALLRLHEGVRGLLQLLTNLGVRLQILLQGRMIFDPLAVVDQRRILAELLGEFRMAVQEPIHAGQFSARRVTVALAPVLSPVVTLFPPHEGVRVLAQLFAEPRMLLQI